ncbi:PIN domain-containing protein [Chryseobacterium pennipullorum]|uniref:PIN domain-containing protein n=1 Tax=Chryseobacterium pennipullorum TaxID=2258963 RepID=UPI001401BBB8|nr:PIN domain-containing protein [Chryseobacterium pennipullorum]
MKVVLDSNIIISDFRLSSPDSKILLEASKKGDIDLYIPKIVLDEIFNKFEERLHEAKSKIEKETNTIKKLTTSEKHSNISADEITKEIEEYKKYIQSLLKENNIKTIDYPKIPHEYIVNKAIKKIKPFNSGEKGYRDSLIWENVKSLMPIIGTNIANPAVLFISNNKKDFCENQNDLHKELIIEIQTSDLDEESIKMLNTLAEFSQEKAKLFFEQANSFKDRIELGEIEDFDLENLLLNSLRKEFDYADVSEIDSIPYQDTTIRYIENADNIKIINVLKLNSTEYLIDLKCNVEMTIDFYVDKYEHYSNDEATYDVEDLDHNDYVIWASELINPELKISLIVDDEFNILSIQID